MYTNQEKVLFFLREKKLDKFKELIEIDNFIKVYDDIDLEYFYGDPDYGTLLDIACRSPGNSKFIDFLLSKHVDANAINDVSGKSALHEAAKNADAATLEIFAKIKREININAVDRDGNTPLHIAIEHNNLEIIKILLQRWDSMININAINSAHLTPLHLALHKRNKDASAILLKCPNTDLDFYKDHLGYTCGELIKLIYPDEFKGSFPHPSNSDSKRILWSALIHGETDRFINLAQDCNSTFLENGFDNLTYLQYACRKGFDDVVDILLKKGVDPNKCLNMALNSTPIMEAAEYGHYELFKRLSQEPKIHLQIKGIGSVLHSVICGMFHTAEHERHNHYKIFEYILKDLRKKVDIEFTTEDTVPWKQITALSIAIGLNDDEVVKSLIYAGANVIRNTAYGITLKNIKTSILEDYLDDCISSENEYPYFAGCSKILFDYKLLKQNQLNDHYLDDETTVVNVLLHEIQLRKLLKHPVVESFLYMKWRLVRKFYFIHLAFYVAFCLALSSHIFFINGPLNSSSNSTANKTSIVMDTFLITELTFWSKIVTLIFFVIIIIREIIQYCIAPLFYIRTLENWLEITMIFSTSALFIHEYIELHPPFIAVCAILTSWTELMLLIGKHPLYSTHIEIFKTVTWNFSKFIMLYSIMILSFAFSFYIAFNDETTANDTLHCMSNSQDLEKNLTSWQHPITLLLKTIIMLTGELDAGSMPLGKDPNYRYAILTLFVFLITIVLYNLLNGLAVSDTQAIRANAELVALMSQAKWIEQCERTILNNSFSYLRYYLQAECGIVGRSLKYAQRKYDAFLWYIFSDNMKLFSKNSRNMKIGVLPCRKNVIFLPNMCEKNKECSVSKKGYSGKMSYSIVSRAKQILENRTEFNRRNGPERSLQPQIFNMHKTPPKFKSIDRLGQRLTARMCYLESKIDEIKDIMEEKSTQRIETSLERIETENPNYLLMRSKRYKSNYSL